jgi:NAD(P)H-nitrite reductase large subunit
MEWLLPRQLNRRAGERLAHTAETAGFRVRTGVKVERLENVSGNPSVGLADGTVLPRNSSCFPRAFDPT